MGKMDARRNTACGGLSLDSAYFVRARRLSAGPAPFVFPVFPRAVVVWAVVVLSTLAGCNDPCVDFCDAAKVCKEADTATDCEVACKDELEEAIEFACDIQLQAKIDCEATITDVCNDQDTCLQETLDYADCRKRIDQP